MQLYEALHGMVPAPFGGMRELLKALKARGVKIALVTGKGARNCAMTLRRFGLEGFFDHVGCGSPEGDVKSQRLVEVLDKYGLEPSEAIYVGDAPSDVSACRRVGGPVASAAWAPPATAARGPKRKSRTRRLREDALGLRLILI